MFQTEIDKWFEEGFSELDWINHVRPAMLETISSFVKERNQPDSLNAFLEALSKRPGVLIS